MKEIKAVLLLTVYDKNERVYGIDDLKNVIKLFNEVHKPQMELKVLDYYTKGGENE